MANKRYYWLKLHDDFFKSKRIKKLRKLGSDFVIIYLKMQLLSLQNNGILEFSGIEDSFASEIALDIDEDEDKVQLTISYLQSCGLLECTEGNEFFLPYVEKLTGSETQSTIRSRKCRENKALEQLSLENALHCNTNEAKCNREKDIDIEKDIDKDINIYIGDFYDSIWTLYPKKKGKGSVSKTQKNKLYKIGYDEISRCIKRYIDWYYKNHSDDTYMMYGSTFFNSGYVDYLDCNYSDKEEQTETAPKKGGRE